MRKESIPCLKEINDFFFEGLGRQSSVFIFGSAATGNWLSSRSDLDLVIIIQKDMVEILGTKIRS